MIRERKKEEETNSDENDYNIGNKKKVSMRKISKRERVKEIFTIIYTEGNVYPIHDT